jgi:hypothetical protein
MSFRRLALCALLAGTLAAGGLAVASPAWAVSTDDDVAAGCHLSAEVPTAARGSVSGTGIRDECSDTVTYFWVRVYKAIPAWPDSEKAVRGSTYVQNIELTANGSCDGRTDYYTHVSTATGITGDSIESARKQLC